MVMDQFVTTYRRDYLWPYVRAIGVRPPAAQADQHTPEVCSCHSITTPPPTNEQRQLLGPAVHKEDAWSRLGPMGPLLNPQIYPAKVSSVPETQISRYNQPNVFLEKLKQKYPYIYECLKTAPPDDMLARINKDRLRTTYQVDFCKMMEYPSGPYDELIRAAGVFGNEPVNVSTRLPGDPYRPLPKTFSKTSYGNVGNTGGGGGGSGGSNGGTKGSGGRGDRGPKPCTMREEPKLCIGTCHGPLASISPGASEYQDAVSRLGGMIIKDRIHYKPVIVKSTLA